MQVLLRVAAAAWLVWLALFTSSASADLVQRLEGRFSVGAVSLREDLLVPYGFTGPELNVGASYGLLLGRHALDVSIEFGPAPVWTRMRDSGVYVHNEISASYSVLVVKNRRRATAVGTTLRSSHEFAYLASWDDAHGYWLDAIMIGPMLRYAEQVRADMAVELRGDVSLLGVASRPPARRLHKQDALNTGAFHFDRLGERPSFTWISDTSFFRVEALLRFRKQVERFGAGFGLGLETRLSHASDPARYLSWYTGVVSSFAWSWP